MARSLSGVPSALISPRAMMSARVHTASTSSRMWVEMMIAFSAAISLIMVRTTNFWLGSSPSVGSSMMSTCGSCRMACAKHVRWR